MLKPKGMFIAAVVVKFGDLGLFTRLYIHKRDFAAATISESGSKNQDMNCWVTGEPGESSIITLPKKAKLGAGDKLIYKYRYIAGATCNDDLNGGFYNISIGPRLLHTGGPLYKYPAADCDGQN